MKRYKKYNYPALILFVFFLLVTAAGAEDLLIDYDEIGYNAKSQSVFKVTILDREEKEWKFGSGTTVGLYLTVMYLHKKYLIPVAPVWYLQNNKEFRRDRTITVTGVMQKISGSYVILPKLIAIGDTELLLRNYDGKPFWNSSYSGNYKAHDASPEKKQGMRGRGGKRGMPNYK